jgi:hypothetical protein
MHAIKAGLLRIFPSKFYRNENHIYYLIGLIMIGYLKLIKKKQVKFSVMN